MSKMKDSYQQVINDLDEKIKNAMTAKKNAETRPERQYQEGLAVAYIYAKQRLELLIDRLEDQ